MRRSERDGAPDGGIVVSGAHGSHGVSVAVFEIEHFRSDLGPAGHTTGIREVVGTIDARLAGLLVTLAVAK